MGRGEQLTSPRVLPNTKVTETSTAESARTISFTSPGDQKAGAMKARTVRKIQPMALPTCTTNKRRFAMIQSLPTLVRSFLRYLMVTVSSLTVPIDTPVQRRFCSPSVSSSALSFGHILSRLHPLHPINLSLELLLQ